MEVCTWGAGSPSAELLIIGWHSVPSEPRSPVMSVATVVPSWQWLNVFSFPFFFCHWQYWNAFSVSLTVTVPSALLQGYFRKGNVLLEMGQQTEALVQFHRCLKLQADFAPAKTQIRKVCSSNLCTHYTCPCLTQLAVIRFSKPCGVKFCKGCMSKLPFVNLFINFI